MKNALTQIKIKNAPDGKLEDGGGLRLVKKGQSGKWVYRYSHLGKRREMGLGSWPAISLSAARTIRDGWAADLAQGRDPIEVRREQQDAEVRERDRADPTFAELVTLVFESRKDALRGGGKRGRWRSPLDLYAIPAFGRKRGSKITHRDIVDALKPIWRSKHPTAKKCIERIGIVLKSGKRMTFPVNPEIVEAAREMLGVVNYVPTPMASVPWQDIPDLYASLGDSASAMCNRWIILTLVRMEAARAACVSEVDGDVWTVPADRVKGREGLVKDFRVPLSAPALEIVEAAREMGQEYLFPNPSGSPVSNAAVEKCLRTMKAAGTPHGFRTSFKTWVQDNSHAWDVSETVLDHAIGGKVERAYARSDILHLRRILMDTWARFVTGQEAKVISLRG